MLLPLHSILYLSDRIYVACIVIFFLHVFTYSRQITNVSSLSYRFKGAVYFSADLIEAMHFSAI